MGGLMLRWRKRSRKDTMLGLPYNANVELRPKEIERAERAYNSSAVCSNNCYTEGQGSGGASRQAAVVWGLRAPCRARTRQRGICGMRGGGLAPHLAWRLAIQAIARGSSEAVDSRPVSRSTKGVGVGSSGDSPGQPKPRLREVPTSFEARAVCPSNPTIELPAPAV